MSEAVEERYEEATQAATANPYVRESHHSLAWRRLQSDDAEILFDKIGLRALLEIEEAARDYLELGHFYFGPPRRDRPTEQQTAVRERLRAALVARATDRQGTGHERCPKPIEKRWWFRLDEWGHRHLPRWTHRLLCIYVERRLWGKGRSA